MAINYHAANLLLYARARGIMFGETLTLGRLHLVLDTVEAKKLESIYSGTRLTDLVGKGDDVFAEPLFERLGSVSVDALDYSSYQGAKFCHDLNESVGNDLKGSFDTVFDGGTLEHVFNFPTAVKNCMELLRPGGYFLSITPSNNWMGHGFYQFSPELYFRVFSGENGFETVDLFLVEDGISGALYAVDDPAETGGRVSLNSPDPVYILAIAKRTGNCRPFENIPQQSDYAVRWEEGQDGLETGGDNQVRQLAKRLLPGALVRRLQIRAIGRRYAREKGRGLTRIPSLLASIDRG